MSDHTQFFRAFLRQSRHVGAIAPSSHELACLMVDWIDWSQVRSVVEFGAGTGVFTEIIAQRKREDALFFSIERDEQLALIASERCPGVTVHNTCVSEVARLSEECGMDQVDVVICGLPWAAFPPELQEKFLQAMFTVLRPGGSFATFAYWQGLLLPAGQRFRKKLRGHFTSVRQSPTAWRNVPPAFVYRCVR